MEMNNFINKPVIFNSNSQVIGFNSLPLFNNSGRPNYNKININTNHINKV